MLNELEQNSTLIGLVGLQDEDKPELKETLEIFEKAGI
jgi:magnesium-transporting ATPase (P-type)